MTTPKIRTARDTSGNRWYVNPLNERKYPSVTTITGMLPKPFLRKWNAKMVAEEAVDLLTQPNPFIQAFAVGNPEGAVDFLKSAPWRRTRSASQEGEALHSLAEKVMLGQPVGALTPLEAGFAANINELLNTVELSVEHVEETVWSDEHRYAGTFDLAGTIDGVPAWVDWKSNAKGIHADVALQLTAYAHAEFLLAEDGATTPNFAAERGVVFWVRPDQWAIYEVPIGQEVFDHFLSLRHTFDWEANERTIIGKPIASGGAK